MLDVNPVEANLLNISSNSFLPDTNQPLTLNSELFPSTSPQKSLALKPTDEAELLNQKLAALPLASTTTTSPDLIIRSARIPTSLIAGSSFSVGYTELNQGSKSVNVHHMGFYLSKDNVLSSNDTLLGTHSLSSLAAGSSRSGSQQLTLSNNLASGTYYLFVKADSSNKYTESNETNNLFSQAITVIPPSPPDLIIKQADIPTSVIAGISFSVNYAELNQGGQLVDSYATGFYLSTDNILSSNDTLLDTSYFISLAAGSSHSGSQQLTLSGNLASGTYYLFVKVDSSNKYTESNETNNLFSQAITVTYAPELLPDLMISQVVIPPSVVAGGSLSVDYTEFNQGGSLAYRHIIDFYLSTDHVFNTEDTLLINNYDDSSDFDSLAAGSSRSASANFAISSSLASGTYYVLVIADGFDEIVESNETNNLFSQAITILPFSPKMA